MTFEPSAATDGAPLGVGEPPRATAAMPPQGATLPPGGAAASLDAAAAPFDSDAATLPAYGAQSMTAPLREVLVQRPGPAFGAAFDDPAHGFRHPVDLDLARREHEAFVGILDRLGVRVHDLGAPDAPHPDLVYAYDPLLVADRGAIPLRSGKSTRRGEELLVEAWLAGRGVPTIGRIEGPGTVDGGDTFWLRPDLLCVGRTLRTNGEGARQLAILIGGDVRLFDVPWWRGDAELIHLLSVVSPVADDLAVVFLPLLPVGMWQLLGDLGIRMVGVPEEEFATLGCNVLAVRPGVCVVADGNPVTRRALESAGCEVHAYAADEIGINGSGGPTCLTRPLLRRA